MAVNDDGATPNYDQSGGPSNLDAPLHQPPGLRAWAEGDPAEHHQFDVHACLLTGAWTPTQCCHQMQHWGKSVRVHIKDGDRPIVTRGRRRRVPAGMPRARRSQPVVPAEHGRHVESSWAALQPTVLAAVLHHAPLQREPVDDHHIDNAHGEYNGAGLTRWLLTIW